MAEKIAHTSPFPASSFQHKVVITVMNSNSIDRHLSSYRSNAVFLCDIYCFCQTETK